MGRQKERYVQRKHTITPTHVLLIEQEQRRTHKSESLIVRTALDHYFGLDKPRDRGTPGAKIGDRRAEHQDLESELPRRQ